MRDVPGLLVLRKAEGTAPVYFLVNHALRPVDRWVPLARPASSVSLLDPLSGAITPGLARQNAAGQAEIRLYLEPGHSVLLRPRTGPTSPDAPPAPAPTRPGETLRTLAPGWQVDFIAGGPELPLPWQPEHLGSWADGTDARRDAFAGTARYVTHFDFPADANPGARDLLLDLGEVREVARVRLNGRELGVTFLRPHRLPVPANLLRAQANDLEIEVTNLAANRLRDLDKRGVAWRNFFFVTIRYKDFDAAAWPLAPSGLLGPVALRALEPGE
jgi:hypothetical protein